MEPEFVRQLNYKGKGLKQNLLIISSKSMIFGKSCFCMIDSGAWENLPLWCQKASYLAHLK